jgi:hypothetical protein
VNNIRGQCRQDKSLNTQWVNRHSKAIKTNIK